MLRGQTLHQFRRRICVNTVSTSTVMQVWSSDSSVGPCNIEFEFLNVSTCVSTGVVPVGTGCGQETCC